MAINKINKERLYHPNFFDFLLGILILTLSFGALAFLKSDSKEISKKAQVYIKGKIFAELSMDENITKEQYLPEKRMLLETKEGRIRVKEADCPLQICAHTGWIKNTGQIIVCVPNKVLVEIRGAGAADYDAVSY